MLSSRASVQVRKGRPSDAGVLAGVFANAWQHTYRGILPDTYLAKMTERRGPDWWRRAVRSKRGLTTLIVCDTVVGYAIYGTAAHIKDKRLGEIFELYVDPDHQGLGFGEFLFESCRHRLDLRDHRRLVTWALEENHRALDFYWRRGGRPFQQTWETVAGRKISKIGFTWT